MANLAGVTQFPRAPTITQAGAVPFRMGRSRVEVLLITSRAGLWGIPKGRLDPGRTPAEMAAIEAYEEAGVLGEIVAPSLTQYSYAKPDGRRCLVEAFALRVTDVLDQWLEASERERAWLGLDEAYDRVEVEGVEHALAALGHRLHAMR